MRADEIATSLNQILFKNGMRENRDRSTKDFNYKTACMFIIKEYGWDKDRTMCMFLRDARKDIFRLFVDAYDTCQGQSLSARKIKSILDCITVHEIDWSLPQEDIR